MAVEQPGVKVGFVAAGADLSGEQYKWVKFAAAGVILAGDGEEADGILQNDPGSGEEAVVCVSGVSKMEASGALAIGALVSSNASGKGKAPASGNRIVGKVIDDASSADGELATVLVKNYGRLA